MESNDYKVNSWDDLNLNSNLLRGIYAYGFEKPSEIQQKAIMPIIYKNDVIAQAHSGTGKTGAFCISTLQTIDTSRNVCQTIIISSTRELVSQIYEVIYKLGQFMEDLSVKLLVGGSSVSTDIESLKNNCPHVVVGTPGRIYDMLKRNVLHGNDVKLFVLDEADEMLSHGFKDQIHNIFQYLNEDVKSAIFSATFSSDVLSLTDKFMRNSYKITMKPQELSLEGIHQSFIAVNNDDDKVEWIKRLYSYINSAQTIIFANDINRVSQLYTYLKDQQYSVCIIHSSLDKIQRENMINSFRNGHFNILISSNITARGIDIQTVNTVINFDVPKDVHTYLHRIGRSGRWGRKGNAINLVSHSDINYMRKIESYYKINIEEFKLE